MNRTRRIRSINKHANMITYGAIGAIAILATAKILNQQRIKLFADTTGAPPPQGILDTILPSLEATTMGIPNWMLIAGGSSAVLITALLLRKRAAKRAILAQRPPMERIYARLTPGESLNLGQD